MASTDDFNIDRETMAWWETVCAETLGAFADAERALLGSLLKPLVEQASNARTEEMGRLATPERLHRAATEQPKDTPS